MTRAASCLFGAVLATTLCAPVARAQDQDGGWRFEVTPYLWAPGASGDVAVRNRSASVDATFADVVEKSDTLLGAFADFEASNGRWSVFVSPAYMDIASDENATVGPLTLRAELDADLVFLEFGGAYRVSSWQGGGVRGTPSGGHLDLIVGARYTDLETEIDLEVAGLPPGFAGAREVSDRKDWIDPLIGGRIRLRLSERWVMALRGDAGGFGVGSDLSLAGNAVVGYELEMFGRDAIVFGGYRALYQDYDDGSGASRFEWDMTLHGPVVGFNLQF